MPRVLALLVVMLLASPAVEQEVRSFAEKHVQRITTDFTHSADLGDLVGEGRCGAVGERLGVGPNIEWIERAWEESPPHAVIPTLQDWDYRYTAQQRGPMGRLYVVDLWCEYWEEAPEPDVIETNTIERLFELVRWIFRWLSGLGVD